MDSSHTQVEIGEKCASFRQEDRQKWDFPKENYLRIFFPTALTSDANYISLNNLKVSFQNQKF